MSTFWIVVILCIICGTISNVAASKVKRDDSGYASDDTKMMQQIYRGLQRMENRIEALETLIMDSAQDRSQARSVQSEFE